MFRLTLVVVLLAATVAHLVRRCFFSPLAKVPGPRLAALTYWFECYYDVFRPAQYVFKIKKLHDQYGPVVRIGPYDVSISDPSYIDTIYAPSTGRKRDKDYEKVKALGVDSSVGGSLGHDLHRRRREALNPYFSIQRIGQLDQMLLAKSAQVEGVFANARERGEILNLSDVYFAFCNDVVHQYCFGTTPDILNDLALANIRRNNVAAVLQSVKVMLQFGWIRDLMQKLPPRIGEAVMPPGVRDMMTFRKSIRAEIDRILASKASAAEEPHSIFTHLRDNQDLPAAEKSAQRLEDEATLITMAGTYSPMLSLVTAHYHLLTRNDLMAAVRTELQQYRKSAASSMRLEQLPYLAAIIQEAHRLTFGLTGRNPRMCPDETLMYTDTTSGAAKASTYTFPPGTSLSMSTLVVHTDKELFPDPWRFEPTRWLTTDQELLARRRRAMLTFMRGPRSCIGKHLANAEIAVLLATVTRWDMRLFETTAEDVEFRHDYHVLCPKLGSRGVRVEILGPHHE
jgi:cytochrome P450